MRGHAGWHWVTGDHTGWHRRGSPIVANPGRILNLGTMKGEMSRASWEGSGLEGLSPFPAVHHYKETILGCLTLRMPVDSWRGVYLLEFQFPG